nr:uncharacterized mitochondrial protein AtMg00810-like [Tanacetum cinerariifolium]
MLAPSGGGLILYQAYDDLYSMSVAGDSITGIKQSRRDLSSDDVRNLATSSGHGQLKEDLELSTWRWRQDYKATPSHRYLYKFVFRVLRDCKTSYEVFATTTSQMKEKLVQNNSQVKFKMTEVEDHHRISNISNKTKSVTAQVRGNPSKPVQTRQQLAIDPEMCMFSLTMGSLNLIIQKRLPSKEISIWIEASFKSLAKYALEILKKHGMDNCDSIDLVQAVCYCARYKARPTKKHLKEVKRIIRYLKGTINMGLWYSKDFGFELIAFLDADHARCLDTCKITSRGIQFLGDKLVSWMSKKQECTTMSSAEAETAYQLADMFTKALPEERFQYLVRRIDNDIYSTVDACPNACEMWKAIERLKQSESINVQDLETNLYWEFGKFTSQDGESLESYYLRFYKMMNELIRNQCKVTNHQVNIQFLLQLQPEWQRAEKIASVANPLALVAQQQLVYHSQHHPNQFTQNSSTRSQQAATRNRGKAIVNSLQPIYDQEPPMVNEDNETSKDKEIDKLMALISLSNVRYENQRNGTVAGARETVGSTVVHKSGIQYYNCKEFGHVARECQKPKRVKDAAYHREKILLCKQEEAGIQLNAEQVSLDAADFEPIFDDEPLQKVSNDDHYNVFAIEQEIDQNDDENDIAKEVIPATSVSRPHLKSNQMEDRVLLNNSQGKKQEVEDHHRNVKFSKNKTSVTTCNDNLNAKNSNVNFVCVTCRKCVLNDNHDKCVLYYLHGMNSRTKMPIALPISTREPKHIVNQSVATPLRRTVILESTNQKPRHTTMKLYEHVTKTCSWWYPKFTPPGYKWKPKSQIRNLVEIILFIVDSGCSKHMTGNLKLLTNFVEEFMGSVKFENDQIEPIFGYGDLVQGIVTIKRVYYVEGLHHNLFSVGQFCDADLEVAFWKSTCYIRDLKGNDLLTGDIVSSMVMASSSVSFELRHHQFAVKEWYYGWSSKVEIRQRSSLFFLDGENLEKMKEKDQISSDPAPECSTMALNHDSLSPTNQHQANVPQAYRTVTTSNELDLLFSPMFHELLNGSSKVVSKYSAVSAADAPN